MEQTRILKTKINNVLLILTLIAIICIFLPWGHGKGSISYSGGGFSGGSSSRTAGISGISFGAGFFAFVVTSIYAYFLYKKKIAPRAPFIILPWLMLLSVIGFIITISNASVSSHTGYGGYSGSARGSVEPDAGVAIFFFLSIIILICSAFRTKKISESSLAKLQVSKSENSDSQSIDEVAYKPESTTFNEPGQKLQQIPSIVIQELQIPTVAKVTDNSKSETNIVDESQNLQPVQVPISKKSNSIYKFSLIALGLIITAITIFYITNNSSERKKQKIEQSIKDEKERLDQIINQVNQSVLEKNYEEALLNVNSVNWLYEPGYNDDYVEQYKNQRENLRQTILQLKSNQDAITRNEALEKERLILQKSIYDSLNLSDEESIIYADKATIAVDRANQGKGNPGNGGETENPGDLENPNGFPDSKNHPGSGKGDSGISYDLAGRSIVKMPSINDQSRDFGKVIIGVIVDMDGNVTTVNGPARGSTTSAPILVNKAKQAALEARFSKSLSGVEEQRGTITFLFTPQ